MPGGRPSKYKPEFCAAFIQYMKDNEGASLVEFAVSIGVSKHSIYEWRDVHPEFSDALSQAMSISESWWARQGRQHLLKDEQGRDTINTGMYKWNTAARFRWSEKQEIEQTVKSESKLIIDMGDDDGDDEV